MTADDFAAWLEHMGFNILQASARLGMSRNTVARYMKEGAPVSVGLACAALAFGLPAWRRT